MAAGAAARRDPAAAGEKRVLCVGLVCLDIISVVEAYPAEDSDTRYRVYSPPPSPPDPRFPPPPAPGPSRHPRPAALQVRVAAMAAGWECLQLLHGAGAAGSPLRLHGLAGPRARRRVSVGREEGVGGAECRWGPGGAPPPHPDTPAGPSASLPPAASSWPTCSATGWTCATRCGSPPAACPPPSSSPAPAGAPAPSCTPAGACAPHPTLCPPSFIVADFRRRGVDVSHVAWQPRGDVPCACCVVNAASGSRTIVLYDT